MIIFITMELTSDTIMKLISSLLSEEWYSLIDDISVEYQERNSNNHDAVTVYVTLNQDAIDNHSDDKDDIEFEIESNIRNIVKYISPSFVFVVFL